MKRPDRSQSNHTPGEAIDMILDVARMLTPTVKDAQPEQIRRLKKHSKAVQEAFRMFLETPPVILRTTAMIKNVENYAGINLKKGIEFSVEIKSSIVRGDKVYSMILHGYKPEPDGVGWYENPLASIRPMKPENIGCCVLPQDVDVELALQSYLFARDATLTFLGAGEEDTIAYEFKYGRHTIRDEAGYGYSKQLFEDAPDSAPELPAYAL